MIKNLFHKLLGKPAAEKRRRPSFGKRVEVPASIHHIDPALVDDRAKDVVQTLRRAGFDAYIVGGAVRDLLVGLKPKDFDVATNATPQQIKNLFDIYLEIVDQVLIFDNSEGKPILIAEKNFEEEIVIHNLEKFNDLKNYYDKRS